MSSDVRQTKNCNETNTFSNGCLGSHNDEERSEMRYVMRIAKYVSHQNFERNLHYFGSMSVGVSVHPHHKTMCVCGVGFLFLFLSS